MSTPPKRDAKAAAKRRAAARRRNREIGRQLFAYGIIAILVIGTVATVLVQTVGTTGVTPTSVVSIPTADNSGLGQLLTQADQAVAASNWITATGLYRAYIQASTSVSGDVYYKLANAIVKSPTPDYLEAARNLQQAVNILGSTSGVGADAQTLLNDIQPQVQAAQTAAAATASVVVTATATITSTAPPLATFTPTVEPVGPVLGTAAPTKAP